MQNCPHCHIEVGGNAQVCPLCQNPLTGTPEESDYPEAKLLKRFSLFSKIALFLTLSAVVISLALDYLVGIHGQHHWSILVGVFCLSGLLISSFLIETPKLSIPRFLFQLLLLTIALSLFTDWFLDLQNFSLNYLIPIFCSAVLVTDVIFLFLDTRFTENTLVYFLMNLLIGIVPYIVLALITHVQRIPWIICLVISILSLFFVLIFKGRALFQELVQRLHL